MKKINEIFYSLQGEGRNTGRAAVFVRFSGCNLKCPFCDTEHQSGTPMTDEMIIAEAKKYPTDLIVLTGGEPTLFIDEDFISKLHDAGFSVAIETNGTHPVPFGINFITVSPKFEFCEDAALALKECDELKVVFTGKNDFSKYEDIKAHYRYIQPCDTGSEEGNRRNIEASIHYVLNHPEWRLSLQTQKITNIR